MSEKLPAPIALRLPASLRAGLDESAKQGGRSLNAEIRMRLEASFRDGGQASPADQASELETLRARVRVLEDKLELVTPDRLKTFAEIMDALKRGEIVFANGSDEKG